LILVNFNRTSPRELIVQTGAYGEHLCERVQLDGASIAAGRHWFRVRLDPGAGDELITYRRRFARTPSARLPWQTGP